MGERVISVGMVNSLRSWPILEFGSESDDTQTISWRSWLEPMAERSDSFLEGMEKLSAAIKQSGSAGFPALLEYSL